MSRLLPALRGVTGPERRATTYLPGFYPEDAMGPYVPGDGAPWHGVGVTDETAMRLGAVWACVRFLSDLVSVLPIDVFRDVDGIPKPLPLPKLLVEPMPDQGFDEWISQAMISVLLRGNVYGLVTELSPQGYPATILLQNPSEVTVRARHGAVEYDIARARGVDPSTVMHFRGRRFAGAQVGMSPIEFARHTVGLGLSTVEFGYGYFRDGGHPTMLVRNTEQDITNDQADSIKARIKKVLGRRREPLVLGKQWDAKPWQITPNDSQFLETIKANRTDIANIYGLPAEWIGGDVSSSMTYSNLEQRSLNLLVYTADWWLCRWERFLSRRMPGSQYAKFNRAALLRTDLLTQLRAIDIQLRNGTMNADEARAILDRPPLPEGQGQAYVWPPLPTYPPAPVAADPTAPPAEGGTQ